MDEQSLALILVIIAFAVIIIRSLIDAYVYRDVLRGYRTFVSGLTSNINLTNTVESRYLALNPEQRKRADQALDLVGWLADLTPTDADDALKRWSKEVRDGLPNTPPAAG